MSRKILRNLHDIYFAKSFVFHLCATFNLRGFLKNFLARLSCALITKKTLEYWMNDRFDRNIEVAVNSFYVIGENFVEKKRRNFS